jgi:hypothetical protein
MDSEIEKIITEQMKKLPEDVVAAIISVDYKTKLQDVVKRQKLLIDQIGKLEMETTLVMLGLETVADYPANLERELGINSLRAKEIALDISENIFKPIRDSLKKMNDELGQVEGEEEPPVVKFTDSNEVTLNRDQILNEIENPVPNRPSPEPVKNPEVGIETAQSVQTIPGQVVKDVSADFLKTKIGAIPGPETKNINSDLLKAKLSGVVINNSEVIDAKPESKLPEINKKRPASGVDPYREPLA